MAVEEKVTPDVTPVSEAVVEEKQDVQPASPEEVLADMVEDPSGKDGNENKDEKVNKQAEETESGVTTADDVQPFVAAATEVPVEASYIDEAVGENKRSYEGQLGKFEYDPRMYRLELLEKPADEYGPASQRECLRYIGEETDGSKIQVPEGLKDGSLLFSGTKIESAPKLPMSLENADGMFADCHQLKNANIMIPPRCEEASFMFANCENLQKGPRVIPGSCKNADYAFASCASLSHTPRIGNGVESANGMFMDCRSMPDTPKVPKSVKQANNMTFGCTTLDKERDKMAQQAHDKAREKFEKKLNRPTLGARMGSMFSAMLQVHAMRKMGYGIVAAPLMTHAMRKSGVFSKDMHGGIGAVALSRGGAVGRLVYQNSQRRSEAKAQKAEERKARKLEQWDRLYGQGTEFNRQVKSMAAKGSRDQKNGLFTRILMMETSQKNIYKESHGLASVYKAQEDMFASHFGNFMAESEKKGPAQWYKDQLADKVAYFTEAEAAIRSDKKYSTSQRDDALAGLDEMRKLSLEPMTESMHRMQDKYQMFNQGDQRDIDKMMQRISGESVFHTEQQREARQYGNLMDQYVSKPAPEHVRESEVKENVETTHTEKPKAPSYDVDAEAHQARVKAAEGLLHRNVSQPVKEDKSFGMGE